MGATVLLCCELSGANVAFSFAPPEPDRFFAIGGGCAFVAGWWKLGDVGNRFAEIDLQSLVPGKFEFARVQPELL